MVKPSLSDFSDFVEKPKPVIIKSKIDIQKEQTMYMNIILVLIVGLGIFYLYYRKINLDKQKKEAKEKINQLDDYMNDYLMHTILEQQNYNAMLEQQNNNIS